MPTSQYRPFATAAGANTLSAAAYAATQTAIIGPGYVAGLADAQHTNTVLRQSTVGVAGLALFATTYGLLDCLDDGSPANFAAAIKSALDALVASAIPAGITAHYAAVGSGTPPAGWLLCNGGIVSRTTYARLFAAIGTTYNTGGESGAQFRLPDGRGLFLRGLDLGRGVDPGRVVSPAAQDHTFGAHKHLMFANIDASLAITPTNQVGYLSSTGGDSEYSLNGTDSTQASLGLTAGTGSVETRPVNLAMVMIIKF